MKYLEQKRNMKKNTTMLKQLVDSLQIVCIKGTTKTHNIQDQNSDEVTLSKERINE